MGDGARKNDHDFNFLVGRQQMSRMWGDTEEGWIFRWDQGEGEVRVRSATWVVVMNL